MLGIGTMLGLLGGNEETVNSIKSSINKTIETVAMEADELRFFFTDKSILKMWDDGQSCCESRYMVCDDDLQYYAGTKLLDFELADAPDQEDEYGSHEVQFLKVTTDRGVFTVSNHNEHNGCYGGFWIVAKLLNNDKNVKECDATTVK
jgi:hypothetical protein